MLRTLSQHNTAAVSQTRLCRETLRSRFSWLFMREKFVDLNFYRLVWIFTITSVVGLGIETLATYPLDGKFLYRAGFLWGPFSPIYGLAFAVFTLLLNNTKSYPNLALFISAAILGATFEYCASLFWEKAFGIVAWDYSERFLNIGGRTCLRMAIIWGLIGLLWMKKLLPFVVGLSDRVPRRARNPIAVALTVFFVADAIATLLAFNCWYLRQIGDVPDTPIELFFAEHYDDATMSEHFQTMDLDSSLANR